MSWADCRFSQNCALVPNLWPSRSAVSPVIARFPCMICVIRLAGTDSCRASSVGVMLSSSSSSARISPGWMAVSCACSFVIVHDLDVAWPGLAHFPLETNPPLRVNADAVLAGPIAAQGLEPVAWQGPQILKTGRGIEDFEPFVGLPGETLKSLQGLAIGEPARALIAVADDHVPFEDRILTMYVKRKSKCEGALIWWRESMAQLKSS